MLFLYDKNDIALKGEGRGSLQDFLTEPQVTWNSSGFFELEFTYLIQGDLANHIVRDAYIKTTTKPDDDTYLSFTVYEVEPDYIENTIYVKAELTLLHELRDRVVPSNAYTGTAGAMMRNLKANLDRALDFEIVDNTTRQSYVEFEDTNAYEIIFGDSGIVEATGVEIDINERGFILRDVMGTIHQDELRESDYVSQLTINENHNDIVTRIIPTTVLMVDTAVRDGDRYTRETVETRVYGTPIVSSVVDDKDYRVRTQFVEYRNEQIEGEVKTYTYQREGETETLEMSYYLYEDVSQLNQDALGFFGVNSGIDEPNIELTIETLGLNPVENNYLQSLSKYDIVTVYLEDVHDSYKLYEVQVNETVYEPLVDQITKLGFTTESITLREATRNVNEGRVSSQKLQAELERQRQKDLEKRLRNYIYDARGRRMEFGSVLPNPDEYSNGDIYYLETADGSDIYELVDGAWEFKIGDKTGQIVEDAIREIQEQTDEIAEELETNIGRTDTLFEEWEDMKENLNYDELENSFINIVGNDGKWVYSNNRLHVEGQQTSDVSSNEVILTLEEGEKVLTHNGEGFSVGNDYTFSYANPTFVERPKSLVTVNFDPVPLHEVFVSLSPDHPQYPIDYKRTTGNNNQFPNTYHDKYTIGASSEWYQFAYEFVEVDKPQTVTFPLIYKEGTLTITHNDAELVIDGEPLVTHSDVRFNFNIREPETPIVNTSNVTFLFNDGEAPIPTGDPSVDPSKVKRLPTNTKVMSLINDFGAKGDGVTDDSQALKEALQHSNTEPIILDVGGSEYEYYIPSNGNSRIENYPGLSKGIWVRGNGAVFAPKNERTIDRHEHYLMQIRSEKNTVIETSGFVIDGKHNPQDMFWWISQGKVSSASDLPLQKSISYEGADDIYVHDMTYRNLYGGYLVKLKNYTNVNIQNLRGYDVGGNDNPDSFGTIIHIDGQPDNAEINIDDVIVHGKKSPIKPEWVSWIGIVLENGTTQSNDASVRLADRNTLINVTNSEFYDFESLYHIETQAGNVYWNTDNVKARVMQYMIVAGVRGEVIDRANNLELDILPFMRKGLSSGLYHSYRERPSNNGTDENGAYNNLNIYNSTINYLPKEDYVGGVDVHAVSHADSVVANLHNVTLNNVPRWLVANASANLYDTQVNTKAGHDGDYDIFSNAEQFLRLHGTSKYNSSGQWQNATEGAYPPRVDNTGFVAPPLTGAITDILPPP